jgi:hypothetical protein
VPCYSPLKGYKSRHNGGLTFRRSESAGEKMDVACGQCLGCRADHARTWAARMVHESQMHDQNCFITLTYEDEHMPRLFSGGPGTLYKPHFQKFMKRLRKRFSGRKIRYYQCGEYGDQLDRPHYHAVLFNLDFSDKELLREDKGNFLFISKTLSELWPYGFATIGEFSFDSAAYVAGYCLKKITGVKAHDHYLRCDEYGVAYWLEPEYSTMSRRPGIGKTWYDKYKSDVFPSDDVPVPGKGVFKKAPRYYETLLASESPEDLELLKELRKQFRAAHGDEYTPERLMAKYKVHKARDKLKSEKKELRDARR